jgi:hypothetical protein
LQHLFFCYRKVWFSISLGLNRAKDLLNFGHIDTGSTLWKQPTPEKKRRIYISGVRCSTCRYLNCMISSNQSLKT